MNQANEIVRKIEREHILQYGSVVKDLKNSQIEEDNIKPVRDRLNELMFRYVRKYL